MQMRAITIVLRHAKNARLEHVNYFGGVKPDGLGGEIFHLPFSKGEQRGIDKFQLVLYI